MKLEQLLKDEPTNIGATVHLARIYIDIWADEWADISDSKERLQAAYDASHWLGKGIDLFLNAFRLDPNEPYPGVIALAFSMVLDYLARQTHMDNDPDIETIRQELLILKGAVQFSIQSAVEKDASDSWAYLNFIYLTVCTAEDAAMVIQACKKAITQTRNIFALEFTLSQLELWDRLAFRSEYVKPSIALLREDLNKLQQNDQTAREQGGDNPPQVFLFSGHMIDQPTRSEPRFPPGMEKEALQRIEKELDRFQAHSDDLAILAGAACGGDILFIEACLRRNMKIEVFLPFNEAEFIKNSVSFAGNGWVGRFYTLNNTPNVTTHLQPDRLGPAKDGDDPYERNNLWALYSTLIHPIDRVRLIVLWNGKGGDGPGGTGHMVQEVRKRGGVVTHLDTTKFDYC